MRAAAAGAESALPRLALALVVAIALSLPAASAQSTTLQGVIDAAGSNRFRDALALAEAEPDPTLRAQAKVWLYIRANDFERAQRAALAGLAQRPDDPWLTERAGVSAITLRDGAHASEASDALARILATMPPEQRSTWTAPAEWLASGVRRWQTDERRTRAALTRARWLTAIAIGACLAACLWLARSRARTAAQP
jgi:predicted Zn-dependent protease